MTEIRTDFSGRPVIAEADESMLIDRFMPDRRFSRVEYVVVDAPASAVYEAARGIDFMRVHSPLADAAMWLRGFPERLRGRGETRVVPAHMTLDDLAADDSDWVMLGEAPEREIVFGAVGRFWTANIQWRRVEAADFAMFTEAGLGKVVADFSVRSYGVGRTLLTYETRTVLGDPASRRRFQLYWRAVGPFVGVVLRTTLATIKRNAEQPGLSGQ
jgi:hypothetical protein